MPNETPAIMTPAHMFAGSGGSAARLIASGMNVNALRPYAGQRVGGLVVNALLRKDEWKELDAAVVDVARDRLNGIAELRRRGLVRNLGGLGTLIAEYERLVDMSDANLDMSGRTAGELDTPGFDLVGVPVPIIHKDFEINIRRLEASRRLGDSLDTTGATVAARKVADRLESVFFNGATLTVGGSSVLYGLTTHPNRNTGSSSDWGTIANIFTAVNAMVAAAEADGYYGPFVLWASTNQYAESRAVYTDGSGQSAMMRCLDAIPALEGFLPSDKLADGTVVLANMSADVVQFALAQDIVTVEWSTMGGMVSNFKVLTAAVPIVKSDSGGNSGIVHFTGA